MNGPIWLSPEQIMYFSQPPFLFQCMFDPFSVWFHLQFSLCVCSVKQSCRSMVHCLCAQVCVCVSVRVLYRLQNVIVWSYCDHWRSIVAGWDRDIVSRAKYGHIGQWGRNVYLYFLLLWNNCSESELLFICVVARRIKQDLRGWEKNDRNDERRWKKRGKTRGYKGD